MPQKKPQKKIKKSTTKQTPKRRTAVPARAARPTIKPIKMRLVMPPPEPEPTAMIEPSHDLIAPRAYEIWEAKLRLANDSVGNWLEAQDRLRAELNPTDVRV